MKSIWRFGFLRLFGFPHRLFDTLQENRTSRFEYLPFISALDFDHVFLRPESEVGDIRAVTKRRTEAATPAYKLLGVQVRIRRRSIKKGRRWILKQFSHVLSLSTRGTRQVPYNRDR